MVIVLACLGEELRVTDSEDPISYRQFDMELYGFEECAKI